MVQTVRFGEVSVPVLAGQKSAARPVAQPRFGNDLATIGTGLIQSALTQQADKKNSAPKFNWKNFFTLNLIGTTTVAVGFAYSDVVYREYLFGLNRYFGHPLEQHKEYDPKEMADYLKAQQENATKPIERLPDGEPTVTVNQMIRMARETKVLISSKYLYQMAKAGLVKEVHTPLTDKVAAPGVIGWNVVLVDGTVLKSEIDLETRDKLETELKIPIRHPSTGFNIGWLEASLLAAVLVNGVSNLGQSGWYGIRQVISSLSGKKIKPPGPTEDDKKLMAMYKTGRLLVGTVLNVESEPLNMEMIEARMGQTALNPERRLISQEELKNRLVVLMAGPAVERKQNDENLSIGSSGTLELASRISALMAVRLGMGTLYGRFIPSEIPTEKRKEEVETEIRKIFDDAEKRAREIIDQYSDRLEPLHQAVTELHKLTREEILSILEGKNTEDIKKQRSYFYRLKQRWFNASGAGASNTTTPVLATKPVAATAGKTPPPTPPADKK